METSRDVETEADGRDEDTGTPVEVDVRRSLKEGRNGGLESLWGPETIPQGRYVYPW